MDISEYLAEAKMTQTAFAEMIGVHPVTLNRWINGHAMPRRAEMAKIRAATCGLVTASDMAATFHGEAVQ